MSHIHRNCVCADYSLVVYVSTFLSCVYTFLLTAKIFLMHLVFETLYVAAARLLIHEQFLVRDFGMFLGQELGLCAMCPKFAVPVCPIVVIYVVHTAVHFRWYAIFRQNRLFSAKSKASFRPL